MKILITGGAGFIGTNAAQFFLPEAEKIIVLDNFLRPTSKKNADYLKKLSAKIEIYPESILNTSLLEKLSSKVDVIIHLAGQVAVTTSLDSPQNDFEINAVGSFSLLECVRKYNPKAVIVYASTNKVYGDLEEVKINKKKGVDESTPVDFYSPYGCSKGAADMYMRDYSRSFGLKTVVFRQSCIYGPWQYGVEDQGWLAFFTRQILNENIITIFGNGKQVRDLLYVDDLLKAYSFAIEKIHEIRGEVFNIGGGPENALSLVEAIDKLEAVSGKKAKVSFGKKRIGDQDFFVSNNNKLGKKLDWKVNIKVDDGLSRMMKWCKKN